MTKIKEISQTMKLIFSKYSFYKTALENGMESKRKREMELFIKQVDLSLSCISRKETHLLNQLLLHKKSYDEIFYSKSQQYRIYLKACVGFLEVYNCL